MIIVKISNQHLFIISCMQPKPDIAALIRMQENNIILEVLLHFWHSTNNDFCIIVNLLYIVLEDTKIFNYYYRQYFNLFC